MMFLKNSRKSSLSFCLTIALINMTQATKCGGFYCDDNSECQFDNEKSLYDCVCIEGYIRNVIEKYVECFPPKIVTKEQECLKEGDKCGPNHECNNELICQEWNDDDDNDVEILDPEQLEFNCQPKEQKCGKNCCLENEICQDGNTCILKSLEERFSKDKDEECPQTKQCLTKCCKENEICDAEQNECVFKEGKCPKGQIYSEEAKKCNLIIKTECLNEEKCGNKCCSINETCNEENQCEEIFKGHLTGNCSPEHKCGQECCKIIEDCSDLHNCVGKNSSNNDLKLLEFTCNSTVQNCAEKCCQEKEICQNGVFCILDTSEESLEDDDKCPQTQQCLAKCCKENEICETDTNECVLLKVKCPESELYSETAKKCVPVVNPECLDGEKCDNKCCNVNEICNAENQCKGISEEWDCPPQQKCGKKCCSVNEFCNKENHCEHHSEVLYIDNCPPEQKCAQECCLSLEVCNDLLKCVSKNLPDVSQSNDFPSHPKNTKLEITKDDFDVNVPLYDFEVIGLKDIECLGKQHRCLNKCCNEQQICQENGDCKEEVKANSPISKSKEQHSLGVQADTISLAYTMIGLGCLVIALAVGLFQIYSARRSDGYQF